MTDLAINGENRSKRYRLGQREPYKTLRSRGNHRAATGRARRYWRGGR
jgi:hypothetical protein